MGKGHRDNFKARKKRGKVAFDKKKKRRAKRNRRPCKICGTVTRLKALKEGACLLCWANKL